MMPGINSYDLSMKTDLYRREGKGRRCCLGDRIDSIPCRASYFAVWAVQYIGPGSRKNKFKNKYLKALYTENGDRLYCKNYSA